MACTVYNHIAVSKNENVSFLENPLPCGGGMTRLQTSQPRNTGGADKSLARPGRKQATTTKLGIYSA